MIKYPVKFQKVKIHYRKTLQNYMPYHGSKGYVIKVSKGPGPINILIGIRGKFLVVPRGNLNQD